MLAKFFRKGRAGLAYVLGVGRTVDPRQPKVLAGEPGRVEALIDASSFSNAYTSAVLTYDRELSQAEAERDMMSFDQMILPGMTPGLEYERVWVRHTELGDGSRPPRTALHWVCCNTELSTGKRLQPYFDRVDRKRVKAWQEITNAEHGYASPDDPHRRRAAAFANHRLPESVKEIKAALASAVAANLAAETINTRDELLTWLTEQGFKVERVTDKSISVSHSKLKKNIRLEGELYELGGIESTASARDSGEKPERRVSQDRVNEYRRELSEGIDRKRNELQSRFARRNEESPRSVGGNDQKRSPEVGAGSQTSGSANSGDQAEVYHLGEHSITSGGPDDGRTDSGLDLGERGQGDGISIEPFAADRGGEVGGSTRPSCDSAKRDDSSTKDALGSESSDQQTRTAASGSKGASQSHQDYAGQERRDLRGGSRERQNHLLEWEVDCLNQTELTNEHKLNAAGAAACDRIRSAFDRLGKLFGAITNAGRKLIRFRPKCIENVIRQAERIGVSNLNLGLVIEQVKRGLETRHNRTRELAEDLQQRLGRDEGGPSRVPSLSFSASELQKLVALVNPRALIKPVPPSVTPYRRR